jgi:hypothetical protein
MKDFLVSSTFTRINNSRILPPDVTDFQPIYWTPDMFNTIAGWWDASDQSTVTTDDGTLTSAWADKSGLGRNLGIFQSSYRPSYNVRDYNGLKMLDFSGSNSMYHTAEAALMFPTGSSIHVFSLVIPDVIPVSPYTTVFSFKNESPQYPAIRFRGSGFVTADILEGCQNLYDSITPGELNNLGILKDGDNIERLALSSSTKSKAQGTPIVLSNKFDRTSAIHTVDGRLDGSQSTENIVASLASENYSATSMMIGSHGGTTTADSQWFNGAIGEFFIALDLTDQQVQKAEAYLAWKWGTVDTLDPSNFYKTIKPTINN